MKKASRNCIALALFTHCKSTPIDAPILSALQFLQVPETAPGLSVRTPSYNADSEGGERRTEHYHEFHVWLKDRYAEYGKKSASAENGAVRWPKLPFPLPSRLICR
jgi:hypothetical protein